MLKNGTAYRFILDQLGSVRYVIVADSGQIEQHLSYDEFGQTTLHVGLADFQPFGFAGGRYDANTGLTRFGVRNYDPRNGRWITKDPIRFKSSETNFYEYVSNDPVNLIDEKGHVGGAAAGAAGGVVICNLPCAILGAGVGFGAGILLGQQVWTMLSEDGSGECEDQERNPNQDKRLTDGEIRALEKKGVDAEDLKGGTKTGNRDLYKDQKGNIYVKPKDGSGPGEPTGLNINDYM